MPRQARPLLERHHGRLVKALRTLADDHADTVMLGRTLLQPAPPVTFGLKAAGWYAACVARMGAASQAAFDEPLVLQFGGASGTLAALGDRGLEVATELGRELGLTVPDAPWHAHRDRLAALMAACAVYAGALGKIATDIALLMQAEVAEAAEPGRRIVDDAAEAEPGGLRGGTRGGDARARTAGVAFSRACRRSTNAASAAGMPKGRPSRR